MEKKFEATIMGKPEEAGLCRTITGILQRFYRDSVNSMGILQGSYGDALGVMKGYMVSSNAGCQSKNAESSEVETEMDTRDGVGFRRIIQRSRLKTYSDIPRRTILAWVPLCRFVSHICIHSLCTR